MYRVQPQRIEVILLQPVERIFEEKTTYLVAARSIVVDGLSPWRAIPIGKVRTISPEVVPLWTEMVVDDVQRHSQPAGMCPGHQAPQSFRAAVGVLRCKRKHSVVTPIACARKLRYRHQFESCHTERTYIAQVVNYGFEGSRRCVGPHVQFVENSVV